MFKIKLINLINSYFIEIDKDYNQVIFLEKQNNCLNFKISKNEMCDDIYKLFTIGLCIKFESFISDFFMIFYHCEKVSYNKPWNYSRKILKSMNIKLNEHYFKLRKIWTYYNSLKHVNIKSKSKINKIFQELNIESTKEAFIEAHKAIKIFISLILRRIKS